MVSVPSSVEDVYIASKRRRRLTTAKTPDARGNRGRQTCTQRRSNIDGAARDSRLCLVDEYLDDLYR